MGAVAFWTLMFAFASAISITLLGQRDLISGNLFTQKQILALLFNWKFILSMILALTSRFCFVMINNSFLKLPKYANSSTTLTTFISLFYLVVVVVTNYIFLKERFSFTNLLGAAIIVIGIFVMLR